MRPDRAMEECLDRVPFVLSATYLSSPPPLRSRLPLDGPLRFVVDTRSDSRLLASCYLRDCLRLIRDSRVPGKANLRSADASLSLRRHGERRHTLDSE